MWVFNRIIVSLLVAGLFALGVSAIVYSMDAGDYRLADLPALVDLNGLYQGVSDYVENVENGNLGLIDYIILPLIALVGLVLLVLEFKPPRPRRVRMQQGTYVTRSAVKDETVEVVEQDPEVLQSNVRVKARRRPGAKIDVRASVRAGEDAGSIQPEVRDRVQRRLEQAGIPVSNLKVRLVESDPRETKTRVN